ncbi:cerebellar degeneration-related protein 2 isoform X2 [Silurus meridionalis]|uniref:cerebellar degeneration-related protein 2 isoform X2 n=1 Tax=Silurus meridionalis TaxID=175797 RepID=UPI001EEB5EC3|nr:cerebellar degeneration-related protein 2 isoform X2 [Silurus meridionalis]
MLAGVIVEEEFEKEQELWYSRKELEHDLHLAAELGKSLLERNHELEQGLQQMYSTNQEQLQEIEYLNKQVELLRQMNDQHTKMYEQLDVAARDLETKNHQLVQENRTAQGKIQSLTETIDSLQSHTESLQKQVEELKASQSERSRREREAETRRGLTAQSVSCLYDLHRDTRLRDDRSWLVLDMGLVEEERSSLHSALRSLHSQLSSERERREAAEKVTAVTEHENRALEEQLAQLEKARRHQAELEAEVEELRELWRSEPSAVRPTDSLVADDVFFLSEEKGVESGAESEAEEEGAEQDARRNHELTCIRRSEAVRRRGISLLNEVDAQYGVLKTKYDELLLRCQRGDHASSHKSVQTPAVASIKHQPASFIDDTYQPEYRALFQEIFTCIQKTKEDLSENRNKQ